MAVRTARLGDNTPLVAGVIATIFTCPAGRTAIVKDAVLFNSGGANSSMRLYVNTGSGDVEVARSLVSSGAAFTTNDRFIVLEPGDSLRAQSVSTAGHAIAFGTLLEGEPS